MHKPITEKSFPTINKSYNAIFQPNRLSIGLVVPIEAYPSSTIPTMHTQLQRIQLAEKLGFSAIWLRDIPFNVPSFGDAGQIYDPFVYLGLLASQTKHIALGVASIILPLRHPAHIAKSAATVDVLSDGRLILGVASGDRPEEYPALNLPFADRGTKFRESFTYIKHMWEDYPTFENSYGILNGNTNLLPKPSANKLPLLITGSSQQKPSWIAQHADGWMIYPRDLMMQEQIIHNWHEQVKLAGREPQPIMQPLYIDYLADKEAIPKPIHLGFRSGKHHLLHYLKSLEKIGINHIALNLRFNQADIETTMQRLASEILPEFA